MPSLLPFPLILRHSSYSYSRSHLTQFHSSSTATSSALSKLRSSTSPSLASSRNHSVPARTKCVCSHSSVNLRASSSSRGDGKPKNKNLGLSHLSSSASSMTGKASYSTGSSGNSNRNGDPSLEENENQRSDEEKERRKHLAPQLGDDFQLFSSPSEPSTSTSTSTSHQSTSFSSSTKSQKPKTYGLQHLPSRLRLRKDGKPSSSSPSKNPAANDELEGPNDQIPSNADYLLTAKVSSHKRRIHEEQQQKGSGRSFSNHRDDASISRVKDKERKRNEIKRGKGRGGLDKKDLDSPFDPNSSQFDAKLAERITNLNQNGFDPSSSSSFEPKTFSNNPDDPSPTSFVEKSPSENEWEPYPSEEEGEDPLQVRPPSTYNYNAFLRSQAKTQTLQEAGLYSSSSSTGERPPSLEEMDRRYQKRLLSLKKRRGLWDQSRGLKISFLERLLESPDWIRRLPVGTVNPAMVPIYQLHTLWNALFDVLDSEEDVKYLTSEHLNLFIVRTAPRMIRRGIWDVYFKKSGGVRASLFGGEAGARYGGGMTGRYQPRSEMMHKLGNATRMFSVRIVELSRRLVELDRKKRRSGGAPNSRRREDQEGFYTSSHSQYLQSSHHLSSQNLDPSSYSSSYTTTYTSDMNDIPLQLSPQNWNRIFWSFRSCLNGFGAHAVFLEYCRASKYWGERWRGFREEEGRKELEMDRMRRIVGEEEEKSNNNKNLLPTTTDDGVNPAVVGSSGSNNLIVEGGQKIQNAISQAPGETQWISTGLMWQWHAQTVLDTILRTSRWNWGSFQLVESSRSKSSRRQTGGIFQERFGTEGNLSGRKPGEDYEVGNFGGLGRNFRKVWVSGRGFKKAMKAMTEDVLERLGGWLEVHDQMARRAKALQAREGELVKTIQEGMVNGGKIGNLESELEELRTIMERERKMMEPLHHEGNSPKNPNPFKAVVDEDEEVGEGEMEDKDMIMLKKRKEEIDGFMDGSEVVGVTGPTLPTTSNNSLTNPVALATPLPRWLFFNTTRFQHLLDSRLFRILCFTADDSSQSEQEIREFMIEKYAIDIDYPDQVPQMWLEKVGHDVDAQLAAANNTKATPEERESLMRKRMKGLIPKIPLHDFLAVMEYFGRKHPYVEWAAEVQKEERAREEVEKNRELEEPSSSSSVETSSSTDQNQEGDIDTSSDSTSSSSEFQKPHPPQRFDSEPQPTPKPPSRYDVIPAIPVDIDLERRKLRKAAFQKMINLFEAFKKPVEGRSPPWPTPGDATRKANFRYSDFLQDGYATLLNSTGGGSDLAYLHDHYSREAINTHIDSYHQLRDAVAKAAGLPTGQPIDPAQNVVLPAATTPETTRKLLKVFAQLRHSFRLTAQMTIRISGPGRCRLPNTSVIEHWGDRIEKVSVLLEAVREERFLIQKLLSENWPPRKPDMVDKIGQVVATDDPFPESSPEESAALILVHEMWKEQDPEKLAEDYFSNVSYMPQWAERPLFIHQVIGHLFRPIHAQLTHIESMLTTVLRRLREVQNGHKYYKFLWRIEKKVKALGVDDSRQAAQERDRIMTRLATENLRDSVTNRGVRQRLTREFRQKLVHLKSEVERIKRMYPQGGSWSSEWLPKWEEQSLEMEEGGEGSPSKLGWVSWSVWGATMEHPIRSATKSGWVFVNSKNEEDGQEGERGRITEISSTTSESSS